MWNLHCHLCQYVNVTFKKMSHARIFFSKKFHVYFQRDSFGRHYIRNYCNKHRKTQKPANKSFVTNLFRGEIVTEQVFPFPDVLNTDEKETIQMLIDPVSKFFNEVNDPAKNDDESVISEPVIKGLWELGAFALQVPQEFGGLGLNNTQYTRLVNIVGGSDLGVSICLGAHQSIGFKGILLYGTPEQKKKYLPGVCSGKYASFCLTEPSCGSDAKAIKTRAELSSDKTHYIINGSKIWITNGGICDVMTVFAQTKVEDPKSGKTVDKMTAFIVERQFGGVTSGAPEKKMGIKASNTTEVFYDNVKVPAENVLGTVGGGFMVAMGILNNGRFGMAGGLSGTMRSCIIKAVEHATTRMQFGKRIDSYQTIQEKLARMAMLQYVTESMAYMLSGNMDGGSEDYHLEAAISKCFASEAAWAVCDECIQVCGGMGYMKHTGLERVLRDIRIFRIFEGTNEILRLFVALSGIRYASDNLKALQRSLKNPSANVPFLIKEATKRIFSYTELGPSPFSSFIHKDLSGASDLLSKSVCKFATAVEAVLLKYGNGVIDQQMVLNRIANSIMDIYAATVVISRASRSLKMGLPSAEYEKLITQCWCLETHDRVKYNLSDLLSKKRLNMFSDLSRISGMMTGGGGVVQNTPLNF